MVGLGNWGTSLETKAVRFGMGEGGTVGNREYDAVRWRFVLCWLMFFSLLRDIYWTVVPAIVTGDDVRRSMFSSGEVTNKIIG